MHIRLSTPSAPPSPSPCPQPAYITPSNAIMRQEPSSPTLPVPATVAGMGGYDWGNNNNRLPLLKRNVDAYGNLQMPTSAQVVETPSAPLARFCADDTNRTLVNPAERRAGPSSSYLQPLDTRIPWGHCGGSASSYQHSYPESADAASAVSYPASYGCWSENGYTNADDTGSATSPSSAGYHSNVGRLSPHNSKHDWNFASNSTAADPAEIGAVDPSLGGEFVSLCTVQMKPDEVDRGVDEDSREHSHGHHGYHGHHNSDDFDTGMATRNSHWGGYEYSQMPRPMEVEPLQPSSPTGISPALVRSGSRTSRGHPPFPGPRRRRHKKSDMMKPYSTTPAGYAEAAAAAGGAMKSQRGRGLGRKKKERQVCPDHPSATFPHPSDLKKHLNQHHIRPFICLYKFAGCQQTFGSKNEWKRHVYSQHLQPDFWSCDFTGCIDRRAIFNRKDLFGQHIKRMHVSTPEELQAILERCRIHYRDLPTQSKCVYCHKEFRGKDSWESMMEHVGQYYEKGACKGSNGGGTKKGGIDQGLVKWSIEHKVIEHCEGSYRTMGNGKNTIVAVGEEFRKSKGANDETDAEGDSDCF